METPNTTKINFTAWNKQNKGGRWCYLGSGTCTPCEKDRLVQESKELGVQIRFH